MNHDSGTSTNKMNTKHTPKKVHSDQEKITIHSQDADGRHSALIGGAWLTTETERGFWQRDLRRGAQHGAWLNVPTGSMARPNKAGTILQQGAQHCQKMPTKSTAPLRGAWRG